MSEYAEKDQAVAGRVYNALLAERDQLKAENERLRSEVDFERQSNAILVQTIDAERERLAAARADVIAALEQRDEMVAAARAEVGRLREALQEQWEFNHAEHCSNEWPHPEGRGCHWPLPVLLGGSVDDWRPYTDTSAQPPQGEETSPKEQSAP